MKEDKGRQEGRQEGRREGRQEGRKSVPNVGFFRRQLRPHFANLDAGHQPTLNDEEERREDMTRKTTTMYDKNT
jgi:hypothetical protein